MKLFHRLGGNGARLLWWTLFAASFGLIEAIVVVYLRRTGGMAPGLDYPAAFAARGLPFHSQSILEAMQKQGTLSLERMREAATIVLLASAAAAGGRNTRERWGIFGYTFAIWDLTYYLYLIPLLGFPRSLLQTDVYFLIPTAWYGPVWLPVLVCMPLLLAVSLRLLAASSRPASKTTPEPDEQDLKKGDEEASHRI